MSGQNHAYRRMRSVVAAAAGAAAVSLAIASPASAYNETYCGQVPSAYQCSTAAGHTFAANSAQFGTTTPGQYICQTMTNGGTQRNGGSCAQNYYFVSYYYGVPSAYWRANCYFIDSRPTRTLNCLAQT